MADDDGIVSFSKDTRKQACWSSIRSSAMRTGEEIERIEAEAAIPDKSRRDKHEFMISNQRNINVFDGETVTKGHCPR